MQKQTGQRSAQGLPIDMHRGLRSRRHAELPALSRWAPRLFLSFLARAHLAVHPLGIQGRGRRREMRLGPIRAKLRRRGDQHRSRTRQPAQPTRRLRWAPARRVDAQGNRIDPVILAQAPQLRLLEGLIEIRLERSRLSQQRLTKRVVGVLAGPGGRSRVMALPAQARRFDGPEFVVVTDEREHDVNRGCLSRE